MNPSVMYFAIVALYGCEQVRDERKDCNIARNEYRVISCNLANIGAFLSFNLRHADVSQHVRQGTDQYQPSMPDMSTAFNVAKSSISAA